PEVGARASEGGGRGAREEAVGLLRRAVGIRPGYIEAYHNLGSALTELGRAGEAEVWLRQAVRLCERSGARDEGRGAREQGPRVASSSGAPGPSSLASSPPSLNASCLHQHG